MNYIKLMIWSIKERLLSIDFMPKVYKYLARKKKKSHSSISEILYTGNIKLAS